MRRRAAGFAWVLLGSAFLLIVLTWILEALNDRPTGEGDALFGYAQTVVAMTFTAVGALVVSRRPENAVGWIFFGVGVLQAITMLGYAYAYFAVVTHAGSLPGGEVTGWLEGWTWMPSLALLTTFLLLLFPDGRLLSRRWRWVAWPTAGAIALIVATAAVALWPERRDLALGADPGDDVGLGPLVLVALVAASVLVLAAIASVVSVVLRFRRSTGTERQQLKWFTYAGAFTVASVAFAFTPAASGAVVVVFFAGLLSVPVATGIAVLRYRLYEIDLIIRRTLVYGVLTAGLAGLYFGIVLLLQQVFSSFAGGSDLAIAGSTLAVAALFRPVRRRIQMLVDRRFYRRKYDAQRTLEAFSARLREEIDLDSLTAELTAVVRGTMQPAHVSLWLREIRP